MRPTDVPDTGKSLNASHWQRGNGQTLLGDNLSGTFFIPCQKDKYLPSQEQTLVF